MIFVSDLHMGGGGKDDDFSPEAEEAYLRLLDKYKDEKHCLVGDTLELLQASQSEIYLAHNRVFQRFKLLDVVRIAGNHDNMYGYERKVVEVGGIRILLIHGHQFDAVNKSGNGLGRYVTQVVGFLERNVHRDIDEWLSRLYGAVKKRTSEYDTGMAALAKENDCSLVVYGHTHFPSVKSIDGVAVANCGCWTHRFTDGYPHIRIDCNGTVALKWWR